MLQTYGPCNLMSNPSLIKFLSSKKRNRCINIKKIIYIYMTKEAKYAANESNEIEPGIVEFKKTISCMTHLNNLDRKYTGSFDLQKCLLFSFPVLTFHYKNVTLFTLCFQFSKFYIGNSENKCENKYRK